MIEVTHHDLKRLVRQTGIAAEKLIKLYSRSDFDESDGNDDDWIRLSSGNRKIGLRKKRDGTCLFLSENRQCTAYEARPMSCRVFPIDIILDEDNSITDLELSDVVRERFITCKQRIGKPRSYKVFMSKAQQSRKETASFWYKIAQWNDRTQRGGKIEFLDFLSLGSRK